VDGAELCVEVSNLAKNKRKDHNNTSSSITSREEAHLVTTTKIIEILTFPEVRFMKDVKEEL
jgi:hypothetical protein